VIKTKIYNGNQTTLARSKWVY